MGRHTEIYVMPKLLVFHGILLRGEHVLGSQYCVQKLLNLFAELMVRHTEIVAMLKLTEFSHTLMENVLIESMENLWLCKHVNTNAHLKLEESIVLLQGFLAQEKGCHGPIIAH